ncbi:MAG: arginine--tRNA ligase, partial [Planctomycetes bacterium]|nr:arginine--tRNA ligase [Planctomycetota bacterium]
MPKNIVKDIAAAWLCKTPLLESFSEGDHAKVSGLFSAPPKPELGDLALGCFPLAKSLGRNPAEIAGQLEAQAKELAPHALIESVQAEGPYLNIVLANAGVAKAVISEVSARSCGDEPSTWHYGDNKTGGGRTVAIDYSSPNIAKPLAVHHLRSTMIGNSLKKIYEANGWVVVGINHLGDWGTSFGKLIAGFIQAKPEIVNKLRASVFEESNAQDLMKDIRVSDLNAIYVEYSKRSKEDPRLNEEGKKEFKALENAMSGMNDAQTTAVMSQSFTRGLRNFAIWEQIRRISLTEYEEVYRLLGVDFVEYPIADEDKRERFEKDRAGFAKHHGIYTGESYYVTSGTACRDVINRAKETGLATMSDGALVVFTEGRDAPPLMLLKDDGATSYHTRDMAAAVY